MNSITDTCSKGQSGLRVGSERWQWDRRVRRLRSVRGLRRGRRHGRPVGLGVGVGTGVPVGLGVGIGTGVPVGLGVGAGSGVPVGLGVGVGTGRVGRIGRERWLGCVQLDGWRLVTLDGRFRCGQCGEHTRGRRGKSRQVFIGAIAGHYCQQHQRADCDLK